MSRARRARCSGQVGGVQSLDGLEDLDGQGVSRINAIFESKNYFDSALER